MCNCAGMVAVCNVVFYLMTSCYLLEIFMIKSQSCLKSGGNFDVLATKFFGEGPLILDQIFIWVTIKHVVKFGYD